MHVKTFHDILTCHSRMSITNNVNNEHIPFRRGSSRPLILYMQTHCQGLQQALNGRELPLMILVPLDEKELYFCLSSSDRWVMGRCTQLKFLPLTVKQLEASVRQSIISTDKLVFVFIDGPFDDIDNKDGHSLILNY